jgi:hypothetical protein
MNTINDIKTYLQSAIETERLAFLSQHNDKDKHQILLESIQDNSDTHHFAILFSLSVGSIPAILIANPLFNLFKHIFTPEQAYISAFFCFCVIIITMVLFGALFLKRSLNIISKAFTAIKSFSLKKFRLYDEKIEALLNEEFGDQTVSENMKNILKLHLTPSLYSAYCIHSEEDPSNAYLVSFINKLDKKNLEIKMIEAQRESFLAHSAANIKQEVAHYL